jgi:hypothetical protein
MSMKLITRHDLAAGAAGRWWLAYLSPFGRNIRRLNPIDHEGIHKKLLALGSTPTPEQVDAVIPNTSWTRLNCSHCHEDVPRVVAIDVTGGEYATHLCENCVSNMAVLFLP